MRKIRTIARLMFSEGQSIRAIALPTGVSRDAVQVTVERLRLAKFDQWPLPDELDDATLEAQLFPARAKPCLDRKITDDDCADIVARMAKMKWDRRNAHLDFQRRQNMTISYSYFCARIREFRSKHSVSMRQLHRAGC